MTVVDGVVALEIEESGRTAHCAHRSNKRIAFAGVVEGTCSVHMHAYVDSLSPDDAARLLGVRKGLVFCSSVHELVMSR